MRPRDTAVSAVSEPAKKAPSTSKRKMGAKARRNTVSMRIHLFG